jgi:hypothetical protein
MLCRLQAGYVIQATGRLCYAGYRQAMLCRLQASYVMQATGKLCYAGYRQAMLCRLQASYVMQATGKLCQQAFLIRQNKEEKYNVSLLVAFMMCIHGDSGGICNTLGNDSMCDSKQKSSYEHGSDFEFDFSLRLVAASLKICYEMCQTSQGFVHCRSSVTQW